VSRIDSIDAASLRARLRWAIGESLQYAGGPSLYLLVLGACWLACSTAEEEERLEELYYSQAREESIEEIGDITSALTMAGGAS
jgi:hypothetical protein